MRTASTSSWLGAAASILTQAAVAAPTELVQLLDQGQCQGCDLIRADLAQAQLTRADLQFAKLEGANLSGANLDGADLSGSDLRFASLNGASLRGANLKGAHLQGVDLRGSDLSGAALDEESLASAHWFGAKGVNPALLSYSSLHNAGSQAAKLGQFSEAERWFSEAIRRNPQAAISWLARGIVRSEQGDQALAAQDMNYASKLYEGMGDQSLAQEVGAASDALTAADPRPKSGNGAGSALLSGATSAIRILAPLALRTLIPFSF